jgi:hypothetical protein
MSRAEPSVGPEPGSRRRRVAAFLAVLAGLGAIVATVRRPPILDLPQLFDQVARFAEVASGQRSDLSIDWVGPNKLGVLMVGLARFLGGATWAPRLAVLLVGGLWLACMHLLAARAGRPVAAAILVSPLLFGSVFYGGYFNFMFGVAALAYWAWELEEPRRDRSFLPIALTTAIGALLFYLSHVLWLFVGGFAVATFVLLFRFRPVEASARLVGVLFVVPLLMAWNRGQQGSGWQTLAAMMVDPIDRVTSLSMASSLVLGGVRHVVEPVVLSTLLLWVALGAVRAVRERGGGVHPFLLVFSLVSAAVAVFAPDTVDKTMHFAWRWGGLALATALLALPSPRASGRWLLALASVVAATHAVVTGGIWYRFDRVEMAGFEAALARVPAGARLLAANIGDPLPRFATDPLVHQHVYATTERGATVAFTFAEFGNSLVRRVRAPGDGDAAEPALWQPGILRPSDIRRFSHLMVRCPPDQVGRLRRYSGLLSIVEGSGQWGLFEVAAVAAEVPLVRGAPAPEGATAPRPELEPGGPPETQRPASHQAPAASARPG